MQNLRFDVFSCALCSVQLERCCSYDLALSVGLTLQHFVLLVLSVFTRPQVREYRYACLNAYGREDENLNVEGVHVYVVRAWLLLLDARSLRHNRQQE